MSDVKLLVKLLRGDTPSRAHPTDAGIDLAYQPDDGSSGKRWLYPGQRMLVETGIAVAVPEGYEAQVRPRSGWAAKRGITVLNTPGTIDSGYRGEVKVILQNHGDLPVVISTGDRIAQLVVAPVVYPAVVITDDLPDSDRGDRGCGSTGN